MKSLVLSPLALSGAGLIAGCGASELQNDTIADLHKLFVDPPVGARPFFRWWWNGNRVDRAEITRQLEIMRAAGIGGVEVNPVAMPEQVLASQGDELIWLSDEWIDMLVHTIDEARMLGMEVDLIVGTGWPFGGEFLDPDETIQGVKILSIDLQGPLDRYTLRLPESDSINRMRITGAKPGRAN